MNSVPPGMPLPRISSSSGELGVPRDSVQLGRGSAFPLMQKSNLSESQLKTLAAMQGGVPVSKDSRGLTVQVPTSKAAPMQERSMLLSRLKATVSENKGDLKGPDSTLATASSSIHAAPLSTPSQHLELVALQDFLGVGQRLSIESVQNRPSLVSQLKAATRTIGTAASNKSTSNMSGVVPSKSMVSLGAREIAQNLANSGMTAADLTLLVNSMAGRTLGTATARRPTPTEGAVKIQKLANISSEAAGALMVDKVAFSAVEDNLRQITAAAGRWEQGLLADGLSLSLGRTHKN
jgi:hypothetical protein